jgi:ASC-1-like (ASCH) protein
MSLTKTKLNIIQAGHKAVEELIKVAEEEIIVNDASEDLAADRLKNAAATKKLAIFDAFEILSRIEQEKNIIEDTNSNKAKFGGFAESRAK